MLGSWLINCPDINNTPSLDSAEGENREAKADQRQKLGKGRI